MANLSLDKASTVEMLEVVIGFIATFIRSFVIPPMVVVGLGLVWSWYAAGWFLLAWALSYFIANIRYVARVSKKYGKAKV